MTNTQPIAMLLGFLIYGSLVVCIGIAVAAFVRMSRSVAQISRSLEEIALAMRERR
ncbi:MAG: hypothetical protein ABIR70_05805 [Bryobacteraceae bacterium]